MSIDVLDLLPTLFGQQQGAAPVGVAGALGQGLSKLLLAQAAAPHLRKRLQESEEERQQRRELAMMYLNAQRQQLERAPLEQRYNFLLGLYKQDFNAAYQDSEEFRGLVQKLQGFTAPRVPQVTVPGVGPAAGQGVAGTAFQEMGEAFALPGAKTTGFRTIGEAAAGLGLRLKGGVSPDLLIDDLRRQGIDVNTLLIDPREEAQATLAGC